MNIDDKIIGIVGGMGPRAGLALHERIIAYSNAYRDQDHSNVAHLSYSASIGDRTEFLQGRSSANPAFVIAEIIEQLHTLGATVIGIPCNTSHSPRIFNVIMDVLEKKGIQITLKNMVLETVNTIRNNSSAIKRIGLLTTNGTYKSNVYHNALLNNGFDVFIPDFEFQNNLIHKMIYDERIGIKANFRIHDQVYELLQEVLFYFQEQGVNTVILGCTEFSLIPTDKFENVMIFDSLDVLAKSLLKDVKSDLELDIY